jgi:hypothetical protein
VGTVGDALRAAAAQAALEAERGTLVGPGTWQRVHPEGFVLTVAADDGVLVCDIACPGFDPSGWVPDSAVERSDVLSRALEPDTAHPACEQGVADPPEWAVSAMHAQSPDPADSTPPPKRCRWLSTDDEDLLGWWPVSCLPLH